MATRNALMPIQPIEIGPGPNVGNLFSPLMQGIQTYRQGMAQQFEGERALASERMNQDRLQLAKNADSRAGASHDIEVQKAKVQQIAGLAQMADGEKDPARRGALMQRIYGLHPGIADGLKAAGIDPNDHDTVPKFLVAEARGYQDPTEAIKTQAQIGLIRAQTAAANRREEPEIVRQLRAAGVEPQSEKGRQMILNSIKGGDPISQAVGQAINQQFAPHAEPSPIRPQSYAPDSQRDPNLVLTQGAAAPAAAPPQERVSTPLGAMPPDQARLLGLGLALQGKGEAGKMIAESANAGNLSKEGQNEIDKKMIAASENLTNLASVKAQFRPEFQQIENRLGLSVAATLDKFKSGQKLLRPEEKTQLEAFSAYRADALDTMNNYIKAITGAAMTDSEAQRILNALPRVGEGIFDGDGPTAFKSKLDQAYAKTAAAVARYNYAKQNGKNWQYIGIGQMQDIVRQRGQQLENDLIKANPNIDRSAIEREVTKRIKQEFGI